GHFSCWDVATGRRLRQFKASREKEENTQVRRVFFASDGATMVSVAQVERPNAMGGQNQNEALVWDFARGKVRRAVEFSPFVQAENSPLDVSPDGRLLALAQANELPMARRGNRQEITIQLLDLT